MLNNLVFQGVIIIIFSYICSKIDTYIILFWAFFYVTIHHINLVLLPSEKHIEHHKDPFKNLNFGFDLYDILYETSDDTEYRPDIMINMIVLTILITILYKKLEKK